MPQVLLEPAEFRALLDQLDRLALLVQPVLLEHQEFKARLEAQEVLVLLVQPELREALDRLVLLVQPVLRVRQAFKVRLVRLVQQVLLVPQVSRELLEFLEHLVFKEHLVSAVQQEAQDLLVLPELQEVPDQLDLLARQVLRVRQAFKELQVAQVQLAL